MFAYKTTINLGALYCKSPSSNDIFSEIKGILNNYDAWQSIAMIVADTTAVNTGRLNGVVVRIQNDMEKLDTVSHSLLDVNIIFSTLFCVMFLTIYLTDRQN